MFNLTTASGNRLFRSMVRALDFYPGRPGSNPMIDGIYFSLSCAPFLCYDFHVIRACHGPYTCSIYRFSKRIARPHYAALNYVGTVSGRLLSVYGIIPFFLTTLLLFLKASAGPQDQYQGGHWPASGGYLPCFS